MVGGIPKGFYDILIGEMTVTLKMKFRCWQNVSGVLTCCEVFYLFPSCLRLHHLFLSHSFWQQEHSLMCTTLILYTCKSFLFTFLTFLRTIKSMLRFMCLIRHFLYTISLLSIYTSTHKGRSTSCSLQVLTPTVKYGEFYFENLTCSCRHDSHSCTEIEQYKLSRC